MKGTVIATILVLGHLVAPAQAASQQIAAPPVPRPASSRLAALFTRLGLDLQIYSRLVGVRAPAPKAVGQLLLTLDLSSGRERLLAEDVAGIRTPVLGGSGRILFLTTTGIWAVPISSDDTPVPASRISTSMPTVVFGASANDPNSLVVLDEVGSNASCRAQIVVLHIASQESRMPIGDSVPCAIDDSLSARDALRVSGNRLVSQARMGAQTLFLTTAAPNLNFQDIEAAEIMIKNPVREITKRLDPVWAGPNRIVYVASR